MTPEERAACHSGVLLDEEKIDALQTVVRETYRDRLSASDLSDPHFVQECLTAREALLRVLDLEALV